MRGSAGRLDVERARQVVAETCFQHPDATGASFGHVGLEVEAFPIRTRSGDPAGRLRLAEVRSILDDLAGRPPRVGTFSIEPGAQVEYSTSVAPGPSAALREADSVTAQLAGACDAHGAVLAACGVDLWHDPSDVAQQLTAPRYPAMDRYLARRGPHGALMMRHTCALQVNVDPGPPSVRAQRWLVANLVAPLLTATFATSPGGGVVSRRARTWQQLDPTRTGFPRRLVDGSSDDPVEQILTAALEADVLLVRTRPGRAVPGPTGWTFADWIGHGHRLHGWPTVDDLRYHLTTLFHEVRPRGALELRSVDALPARWRAVPVVLLAGVLEDARARDAVLGVLARQRSRLPALWRRAATLGVADPGLCALAVETWSFALEGASRLPQRYIDPAQLELAARFLDGFTCRGRCPAHELVRLLDRDPAHALAWVAEPVPAAAPR